MWRPAPWERTIQSETGITARLWPLDASKFPHYILMVNNMNNNDLSFGCNLFSFKWTSNWIIKTNIFLIDRLALLSFVSSTQKYFRNEIKRFICGSTTENNVVLQQKHTHTQITWIAHVQNMTKMSYIDVSIIKALSWYNSIYHVKANAYTFVCCYSAMDSSHTIVCFLLIFVFIFCSID